MPTAAKFLRRAVVLLLILAAVGFAGVAGASRWIGAKLAPVDPTATETVTVEIPQGASTSEMAERLHEAGLIQDPVVFRYYARYLKMDGLLKPGEYEMKASMTPESILKQLMEGRIVVYRFTVPEGLTVAETAALLEQRGVVDKDEFVAATATAESRLWPSNTSTEVPQRLEGYLFPDTYDYRPGINAPTVVAMMHDRFAQVWTQAMEVRALELGMSRHEVLTLASIIEEEAQVPSERPTISGVYHNRLRVGMKLDADPTVAYAVGKKPGEPLLLADLAQESPYNTYLVPGLPPGPIAAPGIASIEAALNPASHDYWFFVAKADGSGEHYFATTIEEQTQNIALAEANQGGN